MSEPGGHRFYGELAEWWPLVSPFEEHEEEAAYAGQVLASASIPVVEVPELKSGGGHNAVHLKKRFTLTLVDPAAASGTTRTGRSPTMTSTASSRPAGGRPRPSTGSRGPSSR